MMCDGQSPVGSCLRIQWRYDAAMPRHALDETLHGRWPKQARGPAQAALRVAAIAADPNQKEWEVPDPRWLPGGAFALIWDGLPPPVPTWPTAVWDTQGIAVSYELMTRHAGHVRDVGKVFEPISGIVAWCTHVKDFRGPAVGGRIFPPNYSVSPDWLAINSSLLCMEFESHLASLPDEKVGVGVISSCFSFMGTNIPQILFTERKWIYLQALNASMAKGDVVRFCVSAVTRTDYDMAVLNDIANYILDQARDFQNGSDGPIATDWNNWTAAGEFIGTPDRPGWFCFGSVSIETFPISVMMQIFDTLGFPNAYISSLTDWKDKPEDASTVIYWDSYTWDLQALVGYKRAPQQNNPVIVNPLPATAQDRRGESEYLEGGCPEQFWRTTRGWVRADDTTRMFFSQSSVGELGLLNSAVLFRSGATHVYYTATFIQDYDVTEFVGTRISPLTIATIAKMGMWVGGEIRTFVERHTEDVFRLDRVSRLQTPVKISIDLSSSVDPKRAVGQAANLVNLGALFTGKIGTGGVTIPTVKPRGSAVAGGP
jgi:hypothetical protein